MHTKADVFSGFAAGFCICAAIWNGAVGFWWLAAPLLALAGTNLALALRSKDGAQ